MSEPTVHTIIKSMGNAIMKLKPYDFSFALFMFDRRDPEKTTIYVSDTKRSQVISYLMSFIKKNTKGGD